MSRVKQRIVSAVGAVIFIIICAVAYINGENKLNSRATYDIPENAIAVHFLDVGEGDSAFVEFPDGECMLIDSSTEGYGETVIDAVSGYGYDRIDYIVASHPHSDHIGSMSQIIDNFDIGALYMTDAQGTSDDFDELMNSVDEKDITVNDAVCGETIKCGSAQVEFLAPSDGEYDDLNNYSAVLKISYGDDSFLFTGDAEFDEENELLETSMNDLDCDVLKVGHHGSSYSSSDAFLDAVSPKYAVISCGAGNSYGHPHSETISRLNDHDAEIYRTDVMGDITIISDGNNDFEVFTQEQP